MTSLLKVLCQSLVCKTCLDNAHKYTKTSARRCTYKTSNYRARDTVPYAHTCTECLVKWLIGITGNSLDCQIFWHRQGLGVFLKHNKPKAKCWRVTYSSFWSYCCTFEQNQQAHLPERANGFFFGPAFLHLFL